LIRKASVKGGVTVNPDPFIVTMEWDSLPKDTWTNLGSHTCDCLLGVNELTNSVSYAVYPNPSVDGMTIVSASESIELIEVVNMLGQVVFKESYSDLTNSISLNTVGLTKGIYTIRLRFVSSSVAQSTLVVQ
jgi:hypothetical protein